MVQIGRKRLEFGLKIVEVYVLHTKRLEFVHGRVLTVRIAIDSF